MSASAPRPPRRPHAPPSPPTLGRRRLLAAAASLPAAGAAAPAASPAASPAPAAELAIALRIDTEARLHPVNPQLVGSNTPWVYGSEGLYTPEGQWRPGLQARAQELAPTVLRYPGVPDTHFWPQGVGPLAQRKPVFAYPGQPPQTIVFGTQEYLEVCEALGAQPLIELNMHQGSDAELARLAADWVKYTNVLGGRSRLTGRPLPKVRYWELGNEPYLMEARLPDGRPDPLFLRPEAFAQRAGQLMAAMKAVDPALRFGLPFALDTYSGRPWRPDGDELATVVGPHLGWADKMLAHLPRPQDLGFLAVHYYMPLITGPTDARGLPLAMGTDEQLYWAAAAGSETLRRHLQLVQDFWQQHPRTARLPLPRIGVTEYNSFFTNARQQDREIPQNAYVMTQAGALFVADLIRMMAHEPIIELASQWSLCGNWVFGAIAQADGDGLAAVRPVFHALRLGRSLLDAGHMLPHTLQVESSRQAAQARGFARPWPDMPLASAAASRAGRTLKVLVINKDPRRSGSVRLQLQGTPARQASLERVQAPALFGRAGQPEASVLQRLPAQVAEDGQVVRAELAPASFGLLTLSLAG